ncbi:MAG: MobA/MobL family protein, partial [Alphaproteobacteria bacterium]|nr:MobA/MobL family protein [Alphaproteobacteria bacterium]
MSIELSWWLFLKAIHARLYILRKRSGASTQDPGVCLWCWELDNPMALYHFSAKVLSRSSRNTVRAIAYRAGCKLYDERTDQTFDYRYKAVQHVELLLPKDAPAWAVEIQQLMFVDRQKGVQAFVDKVEAAEKRIDAQVWREFEFALHREL